MRLFNNLRQTYFTYAARKILENVAHQRGIGLQAGVQKWGGAGYAIIAVGEYNQESMMHIS